MVVAFDSIFSDLVAPITVAVLAGAVTAVAGNFTKTQRLRRRIERDAAVIATLPAGQIRGLLQATMQEDADEYAIRRARGPEHWTVWPLRVMAAASLLLLIPLIESELVFDSLGFSTPWSWLSAILPVIGTSMAFAAASIIVQYFYLERQYERVKRLQQQGRPDTDAASSES